MMSDELKGRPPSIHHSSFIIHHFLSAERFGRAGRLEDVVACVALDAEERPDVHLQLLGVVEERLARGRGEAGPLRHRGLVGRELGRAQRPRLVEDAAAVELLAEGGVEAVALGEEEFERVWLGLRQTLAHSPAGAEVRRRGVARETPGGVLDGVPRLREAHLGVVVREEEELPAAPAREGAVDVEGEEPDAGHAAVVDVGAHVQLKEGVQPRHGRGEVRADAPHLEGHHADPRLTLEGVDGELGRDERPQRSHLHRRVHEEELAPPLSHQREPARASSYGETVEGAAGHAGLCRGAPPWRTPRLKGVWFDIESGASNNARGLGRRRPSLNQISRPLFYHQITPLNRVGRTRPRMKFLTTLALFLLLLPFALTAQVRKQAPRPAKKVSKVSKAAEAAGNATEPPDSVARTLVCIDPGHPSEVASGRNVQNGTSEAAVDWAVAEKLRAALEARGYEVVMTKSAEEELVRNKDRALIANRAGAALMLRLHCDASAARGFAVYYPDRPG